MPRSLPLYVGVTETICRADPAVAERRRFYEQRSYEPKTSDRLDRTSRLARLIGVAIFASCMWPGSANADRRALVDFDVVGDAIPDGLAGRSGDATRGRRIVIDRADGNCLICHKVPEPSEAFQGGVGPDLSGVGGRLTVGQLRLRLVDQSRLNPSTVMPPYYRVSGLVRVAEKWKGRPILDEQAIEDVVAYLAGLK